MLINNSQERTTQGFHTSSTTEISAKCLLNSLMKCTYVTIYHQNMAIPLPLLQYEQCNKVNPLLAWRQVEKEKPASQKTDIQCRIVLCTPEVGSSAEVLFASGGNLPLGNCPWGHVSNSNSTYD